MRQTLFAYQMHPVISVPFVAARQDSEAHPKEETRPSAPGPTEKRILASVSLKTRGVVRGGATLGTVT